MADQFENYSELVAIDATDFASWSKLLAVVEEGASTHPERVEPTRRAVCDWKHSLLSTAAALACPCRVSAGEREKLC